MLSYVSMMIVLVVANLCALEGVVTYSICRFMSGCSLKSIVGFFRMNFLRFLYNCCFNFRLCLLWFDFGSGMLNGVRGVFIFFILLTTV